MLNLTQKQIDSIKIVFMIGLLVTMIILSVVIWKYGSLIKTNPCELCNCSIQILKGGIR